jgi:nickel/cobalt transporter (NicO) family protein
VSIPSPARFSPAGARRVRSRGGARRRVAALAGAVLALLLPALALAHPLGNFTINHFTALRISPDRISLDVVIDRAEIPAFQELQRLDPDGDGALAPRDIETERRAACLALAGDLALSIGGASVAPALVAAGLSLPPGAGGLPTMRLACQYQARLVAPLESGLVVRFEDRSFAGRIGWREIVVLGDRVTIDGDGPIAAPGGISRRLTDYPADLLAQPLDMRAASVQVALGGPSLPEWTAPDAHPIDPPAGGGDGPTVPDDAARPATVPGGIGEDLAALVDVEDLTPLAIVGSLLIALALGVIHALSPGHGKTIMAAYLVAGRGSSRQAVGLGLAVAVSHTLGVLVLAGITLAASSLLPPERLYPILGVVSGALVVVIGASLLWARLRALGAARAARPVREAEDAHAIDHARDHGHQLDRETERAHGHTHPHGHAHAGVDLREHPPTEDERTEDEHGHGHAHGDGHAHQHGPATDAPISWRGLIALGLSGGLVPSASALILLLGSIAAGRVAYGLVLVLGFGAGMALVLAGIGLAIVQARRMLERRPSLRGLRSVELPVQLATASIVVVLGLFLTGQALTQVL